MKRLPPLFATPVILALVARFRRSRRRWSALIRRQEAGTIDQNRYLSRFERNTKLSEAMWTAYHDEAKRQGWTESDFHALPILA